MTEITPASTDPSLTSFDQDVKAHVFFREPQQVAYELSLETKTDLEAFLTEFQEKMKDHGLDVPAAYCLLLQKFQVHSGNVVDFKKKYPRLHESFLQALFALTDFLLEPCSLASAPDTTDGQTEGEERRGWALRVANLLAPVVFLDQGDGTGPIFFPQGEVIFNYRRFPSAAPQNSQGVYKEMVKDLQEAWKKKRRL